MLHGFSTRKGGVSKVYGGNRLNLGITEQDTREAVDRNREIFLKELGATNARKFWPTVPMHQIHSAVIHRIDSVPEKMLQGDGLITNRSGNVCSPCALPIVFPFSLRIRRNALSVPSMQAGAGRWRASSKKALARCGASSEAIRQIWSAAIGPCIHSCCYEVSDDFPDKFRAQFEYADSLFEEVFDSNSLHLKYPLLFLNQRAPGHGDAASKLHFNLVEANRRQLLDAGIAEKNIWISDLCTSCRTDLLFSHRAEFGQTGRMMAAIGIKS